MKSYKVTVHIVPWEFYVEASSAEEAEKTVAGYTNLPYDQDEIARIEVTDKSISLQI